MSEREAWYVEDGFDWIAQAIRTGENYERVKAAVVNDPNANGFQIATAGDIDLAELLTAVHALKRLREARSAVETAVEPTPDVSKP